MLSPGGKIPYSSLKHIVQCLFGWSNFMLIYIYQNGLLSLTEQLLGS